MAKKVCIAFLGNPNYDTRITNLTRSLKAMDLDVNVIAFDWLNEKLGNAKEGVKIHRLEKKGSSLFFYSKFIFLLKKELFRIKADIYIAEDIYTLPFVYFFARWRKAKIFYDSRELYTKIAGLRNKAAIQKIISLIEKIYITRVNKVFVTGNMDADYLRNLYGINLLLLLKNLPCYKKADSPVNLREKLKISNDSKIILYQGVIFDGRGIIPIVRT